MSEHDSLAQRFDGYGEIVEGIVLRGIEHPSCELKRAVAISKGGDTTDRLDFIKLLQGVANSHSTGECLIVIGADQKEAKFIEVDNADDFDPARLSPMFSKFLAPEPRYEIFKLKASTGEQYILFVLNPVQPRPIIAIVDGKTDAKVHFRPGDIWIKHNTGLKNARKEDLDLMYEPKIEAEAAKRARAVIEHLTRESGASGPVPVVNPIPVEALLLGSRESLRGFIEARLATSEIMPFSMLLEMARNTLVDKWNKLNRGNFNAFGVVDEEQEGFLASYSAEYLPVLQSVVDIGLIVITYQGPVDWLKRVVDLLIEAFEAASQIGRLVAFRDAETNRAYQPSTFLERAEGYQIVPLPIGRPAYEVYIGARVLATYATMRKRPEYLGTLLSRFVKTVTEDRHNDSTEPLLFWPFAGDLGLPRMMNGRNEDYWQERVGLSWPEVFGSKDAFLSAAAGLELILELSSHIFVHDAYPELKPYKENHPKQKYSYLPDFWKNPIGPAVPTAEWIFDKILSEKRFPGIITIEPDLIQKIFAEKTRPERQLFFGEFLFKLKKWHDEMLWQQQRFPFYFVWPESLQGAVDRYKASISSAT
jgi:hypothetical protein